MRKARFVLLLCTILVILLCGCGQENPTNGENPAEAPATSAGEIDPSIREQVAAAEALFSTELLSGESDWKDNTLDDYTAVIHAPLHLEKGEGEIGGRCEFALGSTRDAALIKHFADPAKNCWDEFKTVTDRGEVSSGRLIFQEDWIEQAIDIGNIIGSNHFMMKDVDYPEGIEIDVYKYNFFEVDESMEVVRKVEIDFLAEDGTETPNEFKVDSAGNIYFTTSYTGSSPEGHATNNYYIITDSEGTLLSKLDYTFTYTFPRLVVLYDGRIAIWSESTDDQGERTGSRLEYVNPETGEVTLLAEIKSDTQKNFPWNKFYTLWDEETLLYADWQGLHFADLSGEKTGDLYLWARHGIRFSELEELLIQEDGRIKLVYYDVNIDGNLLCLSPTEERVEIPEIVFAVSPYEKSLYSPMVAEFHKRYPAYHIELKTDYDQTALLTELMAGKGPVLIDTMLTGFDNHRELWMPLEGLFSGEQWEDVLIPQAMDVGRIDGILYGAVRDFGLETVVIAEDEPTDWDYEAFLDGVEAASPIQAVSNGYNGLMTFISTFLIHGLEDNYLLDAESGTTYFDSDEFRRVLRLGMEYCKGDDIEITTEGSLREGEVFCNTIHIGKPEDIDLYRICYGEDFNYIGYPTKNGSMHYIAYQFPLAIRSTATDEEKRIAGAFLRMMLSRESQMESITDPNFSLSVRRDVLEEQIGQVNEMSSPAVYGFTQITLGDDYDREYDARVLYDLLEKARPKKYFPRELRAILSEELEAYFVGNITEDVLIERLTRRVGIYLAEQR